jgi:hypothetical protein
VSTFCVLRGSKLETMLELESQIKVIEIDSSKSSSAGCRMLKPERLMSSMALLEETNVGEQVAVCCLLAEQCADG